MKRKGQVLRVEGSYFITEGEEWRKRGRGWLKGTRVWWEKFKIYKSGLKDKVLYKSRVVAYYDSSYGLYVQ